MLERHFDPGFWRETLDRRVEAFHQGNAYAFCIFDRAQGPGGPVLGFLNFNEVVRGVFYACYMGSTQHSCHEPPFDSASADARI